MWESFHWMIIFEESRHSPSKSQKIWPIHQGKRVSSRARTSLSGSFYEAECYRLNSGPMALVSAITEGGSIMDVQAIRRLNGSRSDPSLRQAGIKNKHSKLTSRTIESLL